MELDALPPRVLRDMVRDVIEQHISPEATRALRMLFEYRRGSSLDEIVLGQMWCAGLFQARPEDFVGNDHPNEPCRRGLKARVSRSGMRIRTHRSFSYLSFYLPSHAPVEQINLRMRYVNAPECPGDARVSPTNAQFELALQKARKRPGAAHVEIFLGSKMVTPPPPEVIPRSLVSVAPSAAKGRNEVAYLP